MAKRAKQATAEAADLTNNTLTAPQPSEIVRRGHRKLPRWARNNRRRNSRPGSGGPIPIPSRPSTWKATRSSSRKTAREIPLPSREDHGRCRSNSATAAKEEKPSDDVREYIKSPSSPS